MDFMAVELFEPMADIKAMMLIRSDLVGNLVLVLIGIKSEDNLKRHVVVEDYNWDLNSSNTLKVTDSRFNANFKLCFLKTGLICKRVHLTGLMGGILLIHDLFGVLL